MDWENLEYEFIKQNLTWRNETDFEFFNSTEKIECLKGKFKSQNPKQSFFDRCVDAATSTYYLQIIQLIMDDSKCFKLKQDLLSGPIYFEYYSSISSPLQQHFQLLREIGVFYFLEDFDKFIHSLTIQNVKKDVMSKEEDEFKDLIRLGRLSSLFVISSFLIFFSIVVFVIEKFANFFPQFFGDLIL